MVALGRFVRRPNRQLQQPSVRSLGVAITVGLALLNVLPKRGPTTSHVAGCLVAAPVVKPEPALSVAEVGKKLRYSHVQLYVDKLRPLEEYKRLEDKLNAIAKAPALPDTPLRATWLGLAESYGHPVAHKDRNPDEWTAAGQDVVEQMLVGLGWRVVGHGHGRGTESLVVASRDLSGARFVVTAPAPGVQREQGPDHLHERHIARFAGHNGGREGIAVLAFEVPQGGVEAIRKKYAEQHPALVLPDSPRLYDAVHVLEVFAYYVDDARESGPDRGTVLRFLEHLPTPQSHVQNISRFLPGIEHVEAKFDADSQAAYSDHWVSNVVSRTGFISTLQDVLGFTPKVDFNAGVVAAGEAQIESTVTGNDPGFTTRDRAAAARDQRQVYLPINNAISEVGHVHLYLQELGQGVQHLASRVADLPRLVQRANEYRGATGAGLSFLSIPRSYYGAVSVKQLSDEAGIHHGVAESCLASLRAASLVDSAGIVKLDCTRDEILAALPNEAPKNIAEHVLRAKYRNLWLLAGDALDEETYLRIVRNRILLDVQDGDLLLQIFTTSILQRSAEEEAPFLEFIQRICSKSRDPISGEPLPIRPGCGGFGIRNFLTLFLSIESAKASRSLAEAEQVGDTGGVAHYGRMLELFSNQLEESSPILTDITDAMSAEAEALEVGDDAKVRQHRAEKAHGQRVLQQLSIKYRDLMAELRRNHHAEDAAMAA